MAGPGGAYFNIPEFVGGSRQLAQDGANAGQAGQGGLNGFTPPGANSPHGQIATGKMADWHGQLATAPPQINNDANGNDQYVKGALQDLEGIDSQNAGLVKAASQDPMDPESIDKMDPESIDTDAQSEAKDMLNSDQTDQQMQQIMQELLQEGAQFGQQASQQISQMVNQLNQAMNQVVQQVSQMASQAATQAASHAASDALNAAGAGLADGLGAAGDAGAGTIPAGLEEPVTPMTTSPALVQGTGPIAPAAAPATAAGARMPMMPMMPMHGKGEKDKRKRNPNIFPVGRLYEPPAGTVQNFGANPEIDAAAPPFGT
ncbi:MAG: hypothetical protein PHQ28_03020, partial [Mycobacterium sp.]|nr:hypothetical protein [Mycobacterium sp.]